MHPLKVETGVWHDYGGSGFGCVDTMCSISPTNLRNISLAGCGQQAGINVALANVGVAAVLPPF